jgi:hypothetical protein
MFQKTLGKQIPLAKIKKKYSAKKPKIHFAKSIYSAKPERHVATAVPSDFATLVKSPPTFSPSLRFLYFIV